MKAVFLLHSPCAPLLPQTLQPLTLCSLPPEYRSEVNCTAPANAKPGSQFYSYFVVSAKVRHVRWLSSMWVPQHQH